MYELERVSKTHRRGGRAVPALVDVDLVVAAGESVAVHGPVGSGGSTLLRLLGALDRPTSGTVRLDGADLGRMGASELTRVRATRIGFLSPTRALIPTLTAQEHVEAVLAATHVDLRERRSRAREALEAVGLGDRATHLPSELPGGHQQRIALATALARRPDVLLADEPTDGLDEDASSDLVALLESVRQERGLTLVVATEDPRVAHRAERVVLLEQGRVTEPIATTA